ncbi:hypothetical protein [Lysinibacillus sp. 54212]|uniref:hypothetical protein n=1 Tax=Lysinibacillus sp. 54212 TaxID=3119829 RepID=UPI002FCB6481
MKLPYTYSIQIQFTVGIAALDGGKPPAFTQNLLNPYEDGQGIASQFKQALFKNM